MASDEQQIRREVHKICRRFDLQLQFAWNQEYYVVVDKPRDFDNRRFVTDEADIRGIYHQLQEKLARIA